MPYSNRPRWIDLRRDLPGVADLLATAFAERLDEDGHAALRQLRRIARSRSAQRAYAAREVPGAPLYGFVWEADGRIVGNVSLIPLQAKPRQYLIVNVAVHPAYRRQGIAAALMEATLHHARQRGARAVWLQVETWNKGAIALYHTLGFADRDVVTLWKAQPDARAIAPSLPGVRVHARLARRSEWPQVEAWLDAAYPLERAWHRPLASWQGLAPGWRGLLWRLLHPLSFRMWVATHPNRLLGAAAWLPIGGAPTDAFLLAAPPDLAPAEVAALLTPLRRHAPRPLRGELPQGFLAEGLIAAGFKATRHLLWMKWSPLMES